MPSIWRLLLVVLTLALAWPALRVDAARAGHRKPREVELKSGQLTPASLDRLIEVHLLGATGPVTASVPPMALATMPAALWLRRVSLEINGSVPDPAELEALGDAPSEADRRHALERLFGAKGYAERWGKILARPLISFLREHEPYRRRLEAYFVGAMQSRASWLRIARGLITAEGSSEESPAIGFYLQFVDARAEIAARIGTGLMGIRMSCAQCHDHPFTHWTMEDYYGTAAFFGNTSTYGLPRDLYRAYRAARKGQAAEVEIVVGPGKDREERLKRLERMQSTLAKLDGRNIEGTDSRRAGASSRVAAVARDGRSVSTIQGALAKQDAPAEVDDRPRGAQAVADAIARGDMPLTGPGRKNVHVPRRAADALGAASAAAATAASAPEIPAGPAGVGARARAMLAGTEKSNRSAPAPAPAKGALIASSTAGGTMIASSMTGGSMMASSMAGGSMMSSGTMSGTMAGAKGLDLDELVYLIVEEGGGGFTVPDTVAGSDLPAGLTRSLAPGAHVQPRFPGGGVPADRSAHRSTFSNWLTQPSNPYFARAFVNRVWQQLFGRGLVEPVDGLDGKLEPGPSAVLDALAAHFVGTGYDIAGLIKLIMLTRVYQQPAGSGRGGDALPARVAVRPLDAGQAAGALGAALGLRGSADLAGALERAFDSKPGEESAEGAPERPVGDLRRALFLVGGEALEHGVVSSPMIARIAKQPAPERLEALFQSLLARAPTAEERASLEAKVTGDATAAAAALSDLAWAVCASAEFLTNH